MSDDLPAREGYLSFAGYRTWYRVTGEAEEPGKFPLLCLHGGPGATWHHMEPYTELAADGRRVICYDQLGCGNSAIAEPHDPAMWTTELYLAELDAVREELGLERCHVLGHSWGGMLGMAYAITKPAGPGQPAGRVLSRERVVLADRTGQAARRPAAEVDAVLRRHEAAGTTDSEEYQTTMVAFYDRHVCRIRPYPDWLDRCFDGLEANPEVYHTMNGPSEFHVIGPLKDFDVTADLGEIEAPTLLFCGEFDEVTPATVRPGARGGSRARSSSCSPGARTWARPSGLTWRSAWCAAGWPAWSLPCGAARSWASCRA